MGEVSGKGVGKHTTTATRLYHLAQGGCVIDSPGVREFSLWTIDKARVLQGFKEFQAYTAACQFRDCSHDAEPGCGIKNAVAAGQVSPRRYESYQQILKEISNKFNKLGRKK